MQKKSLNSNSVQECLSFHVTNFYQAILFNVGDRIHSLVLDFYIPELLTYFFAIDLPQPIMSFAGCPNMCKAKNAVIAKPIKV